MKCDKCGAELKLGAKFCTVCGEKVEVQRICPNCGKPIKDGAKFCRECGAAVNTSKNPAPQAQPTPVKTEQVRYADPAPVKTGKNKAAIGIIAAVIAVVVVVGVVGAAALTKFIKAKSPAVADYSLYIKDNELYLADAENEPIKLTDDFFGMSLKRECEATPSDRGEGWYNYDAESYTESYGNYEYSDCVPYEDDKRDIDNVIKALCKADNSAGIQLYPDKIEFLLIRLLPTDGSAPFDRYSALESFNLCYYRLGAKNASPVKIASDVISYSLSDNGKLVVYTSTDSTVYTYDLTADRTLRIGKDLADYKFADGYSKVYFIDGNGNFYSASPVSDTLEIDKTLISENVTRFHVSDDGKTVRFLSGDDYYIVSDGGPTDKMGAHYKGNSVYESEDSKVYYYTDESGDSRSLYKFTVGEGEELVTSDFGDVISVSESGEVYYLISEDSSLSLDNFIVDDLAEQDRPIAEEYEDDSGYWYYYEGEGDFNVWRREELRRQLHGDYPDYAGSSLYCYDGTSLTRLLENVVGRNYYSSGLAFTVLDASAPQVKMSEAWTHSHLEFGSDGNVAVFDTSYLDKFIDTYAVIEDKAYKVSDACASELTFTNSCDALYFIADIQDLPDDTENHSTVPTGNLYRVPIENNVPEEPEIYNTEVADMLVSPVGDSDILYFKNMWSWTGEGEGDFYVNKDLLVYSMSIDSGYNFIEETGELRYQGDDGVYSYKDGKTVFLGEDANIWPDDEDPYTESAFFEEDGNVYLLDDNGNKILIDTGISLLL